MKIIMQNEIEEAKVELPVIIQTPMFEQIVRDGNAINMNVVVALAYEMAAQMRKYENESQKSISIPIKKTLTQENIYDITEAVICNRRGVSLNDIKAETRERHVCETRQIIYYCINELHIKMSLQQRADRYNQKHCTVLYAHGKKIPNMIETDAVFAKEIYDHLFYVREAIQNAKNELEDKILINNTEK